VNYLKKCFFAILLICLMCVPMSALAAGNDSSTQTLPVNPLVIDPDVIGFSNFTVSPSMLLLTGDVKLNGNVPDAQKKMHPVYKFKLENKTMDKLNGLTVTIPYPPGTQLDTSFPHEVLITETNMNRNKEDVNISYDTTTGINLTLPDMEKDEVLTFDVKFFLLPLSTDNDPSAIIDLNKVTIKPEAKVVEWFKDDVKVRLMLGLNNTNNMMMEKVILKLKLPDGLKIHDEMITGMDGASITIKDGYAFIYLPKLVKGESNIVLDFNMKKCEGWDKLQFPLMIGIDGMKDVTLAPLSINLKDMPTAIDWTKIMAKGDFKAEMKKDKLCLGYMLHLDNKNMIAAKSYKLRLHLPASVKIEDLKVSGIEGAKIEMDNKGVIWIMIPSLEAGMSNLQVNLMGTYSDSEDELSTDILTEGATSTTASLTAKVSGITSTDSDPAEVVTDTTIPTLTSGNTLPKTGSPFNQLTWTLFGTLFVLLGAGLYLKAAKMQS
jgi:LPXTG-motif cell wall-anchored protein